MDSVCLSVVVGSTTVVMLVGWAAPGLAGFEVMSHAVPMGNYRVKSASSGAQPMVGTWFPSASGQEGVSQNRTCW